MIWLVQLKPSEAGTSPGTAELAVQQPKVGRLRSSPLLLHRSQAKVQSHDFFEQ
jgi:hypothetical protein